MRCPLAGVVLAALGCATTSRAPRGQSECELGPPREWAEQVLPGYCKEAWAERDRQARELFVQEMETWRGRPFKDLRRAWGDPTTPYQEGSTVAEWTNEDRQGKLVCKHRIDVDAEGKIADVHSETPRDDATSLMACSHPPAVGHSPWRHVVRRD